MVILIYFLIASSLSFRFSLCLSFTLQSWQEEFDAEARSNQHNAATTDELLALQLQHEDLKVDTVCAVLSSSFRSPQFLKLEFYIYK